MNKVMIERSVDRRRENLERVALENWLWEKAEADPETGRLRQLKPLGSGLDTKTGGC